MVSDEDRIIKTIDKEGKEIELYLKPHDYQINALCDVEYKKAWTKALLMGVKTHKYIQEAFNKQEIWTSKDENELIKLNAEIALYTVMLKRFAEEGKKEDVQKTSIELANKRNRSFILSELRHDSYVNSCDGIANEVRMEAYIAYATVYNSDRTKNYFKDYDEFLQRRNEKAAIDVFAVYMAMITTENVDYLNSLPENKYLQEVGALSDQKKFFSRATKDLNNISKSKKKTRKKRTTKKTVNRKEK